MLMILNQQKHILLQDVLDSFFIKVIIASAVMAVITIFVTNFIELDDLLGLKKFLFIIFIILMGLISYIGLVLAFGLRKKDIL